MDKKRLVFFTGAGMSKESGLPTFRDVGGVWDEIDVEKVASARSWYCGRRKDCNERRQTMLNFFNPIRRSILEHEPNEGHRIIAELAILVYRNYCHFENVATVGLLKFQKYLNLLAVQKGIEKQCTFSALPKDLFQPRGPEEFGAVVKRW